MKQNRRGFLKTLGGFGLMATAAGLPYRLFANDGSNDLIKLTVLSTNDVHSRIDPFPLDDKRYPGMAGFARRAAMISDIRKENDHVLLFDAGDIFQGTPYFNMYGGELEFKLMSDMGYDAACMGNHDFDDGIEGFNKQLPHAKFPFLTSNYDFTNTILEGKTQSYKIFQKGPINIGVFGIGIELNGLVSENNYGNTKYNDPIETANRIANQLKEEGCNLIICLSHLGHKYETDKVSDHILAQKSDNIDFIIGGHTHTFLDKPAEVFNQKGQKVWISQSGWGGIELGQMDFYFSKKYIQNVKSINTTKKVRSQE